MASSGALNVGGTEGSEEFSGLLWRRIWREAKIVAPGGTLIVGKESQGFMREEESKIIADRVDGKDGIVGEFLGDEKGTTGLN